MDQYEAQQRQRMCSSSGPSSNLCVGDFVNNTGYRADFLTTELRVITIQETHQEMR